MTNFPKLVEEATVNRIAFRDFLSDQLTLQGIPCLQSTFFSHPSILCNELGAAPTIFRKLGLKYIQRDDNYGASPSWSYFGYGDIRKKSGQYCILEGPKFFSMSNNVDALIKAIGYNANIANMVQFQCFSKEIPLTKKIKAFLNRECNQVLDNLWVNEAFRFYITIHGDVCNFSGSPKLKM